MTNRNSEYSADVLRAFLIIAALICMSAYASASTLSTCMAIADPQAKLDCYEALAKLESLNQPVDVETSPPAPAGDWKVTTSINPIDDTETYVAILRTSSLNTSVRREPSLVLRCKSGVLDAYINWNDYLGSEVDVTLRIGSAQAKTSRWQMSTDNTASFHPSPVQLVNALFEEIRLVAQVTPYNESPVTAVFDLEGYSSVGAQLQKRCLARRVDKQGLTTRNGKEMPRTFAQGNGVEDAVPTSGSWVLPKLVKSPELQYPMRASSRGIEGSVDLVFDVDLEGSVVGVEVVNARPPGIFNRAAINYIRGRQYDPATRNGKPTTFRQIEESVLFTLPQ